MSNLIFNKCDISNLIYSGSLNEQIGIKVNSKKSERKFNDDLKLLISEINFICRYVEPSTKIRIIYIGAAPGIHLIKLMKMFPQIKFDLYDEQRLHPKLISYIDENFSQVRYINENVNESTNFDISDIDEDIYLISDIKNIRYSKDEFFTGIDAIQRKEEYQNRKDQSSLEDMELQKIICKKLIPKYSLLKFRPPKYYERRTYENTIFPYFYGTIWLMIFNDLKSTESRIVVNNYEKDDFNWNFKSYQYRLNYFNDELRESLLENIFSKDSRPLPNQLGNRFEIMMLFKILIDYMTTIGYSEPRVVDIVDFYVKFIIPESCSSVPGMDKVCMIKGEEEEEEELECEDNEDEIFREEKV
jgi:hypothetical protein